MLRGCIDAECGLLLLIVRLRCRLLMVMLLGRLMVALIILLCHQVLLRVDREQLLVQCGENVLRVVLFEFLQRFHMHDG